MALKKNKYDCQSCFNVQLVEKMTWVFSRLLSAYFCLGIVTLSWFPFPTPRFCVSILLLFPVRFGIDSKTFWSKEFSDIVRTAFWPTIAILKNTTNVDRVTSAPNYFCIFWDLPFDVAKARASTANVTACATCID